MLIFKAVMMMIISLILFVLLSVRLFVLISKLQSPKSYTLNCQSTFQGFRR